MTIHDNAPRWVDPTYEALIDDFYINFDDHGRTQHVAVLTPAMFGMVWYRALAIERTLRPQQYTKNEAVLILMGSDIHTLHIRYTGKPQEYSQSIKALLEHIGVFLGTGYYYISFITKRQHTPNEHNHVRASFSPKSYKLLDGVQCQISLGGFTQYPTGVHHEAK